MSYCTSAQAGPDHRQDCGNQGDAKFDRGLRFFRGGFLLQYHSLQERVRRTYLRRSTAAATLRQEEANVGGPFTDDDGVGVGETTAIDVDDEVAGCEARERAVDAA